MEDATNSCPEPTVEVEASDEDRDVWRGLGWKPAAELPREDPPLEDGEPDWDVPRFGNASWSFADDGRHAGTAAGSTATAETPARTGGVIPPGYICSPHEAQSRPMCALEAEDADEVPCHVASKKKEEGPKKSASPATATRASASERPPSSGSRSSSGSKDRPPKAPLASSQNGGAVVDSKQAVGQGGARGAPLIGTLLTEEAVSVGEVGIDEPLAPVSVCVRIRPLLEWEKQKGETVGALQVQDGKAGQIVLSPTEDCEKGRDRGPKNFKFDAIFGHERSQQDVWELTQMRKLVNKVVDGFHATVFAYGQTGSGKTHTMEGFVYDHHTGDTGPSVVAAKPRVRVKDTPPAQLGVVPRAVTGLFSQIGKQKAEAPSEEFVVKVSFLQIYNERIFDLLNPVKDLAVGEEDRGLRLRWQENKQQFYVENLFEYECATADDVLKHYCNGVRNKHMASTAMNVASSRSHAVLVLSVVRRSPVGGESVDQNKTVNVYKEVVSKLSLVDLAGSERASASSGEGESGARAARFQEAVNINQSLFVLRKVIMALSKQPEGGDNSHVPYRESKLTSMLRHSIGGNSYMIMLACISPADKHFEENLSTLQYAARAACIKNEPMMNLDPKDALIQKLQLQLEAAHDWIRQHTGSDTLPDELLKLGEPQRGRAALTDAQRRNRSAAPGPGQRRTSSNPARPRNSLGSSLELPSGTLERAASMSSTMQPHKPSMSSTMQLKTVEYSTSTPPSRKKSTEESGPLGAQLGEPVPSASSGAVATPAAQNALPPLEAMSTPRGYSSGDPGQTPGRFGRSPANKKRRPPSLPPSGPRPLVPVPGPLLNQTTQGSSQGTLPPVVPGGTKKPLDQDKVERYAAYLEHTGPLHGSKSRKPSRTKDGKDKKKLGMTAPQWPTSECEADGRDGTCEAGGDTSGRGTPSTMTPPSSTEDSAGKIADLEESLREAFEANVVLESRCENLSDLKEELERKNCQLADLIQQIEQDSEAHRSAESAVRAGLWEAMDELRRGKDGLESQVERLEDTVQVVREEAQEYEKENERVFNANEKLAVQFRQLEAAVRGEASGGPSSPSAQPAIVTIPSAEYEVELEKLRAENKDLRQAREKLEVFEKALELNNEEGAQGSDETNVSSGGNDLAEKVVRLHSNLVLEASTLRKDIAGLKKKKWVIQSVLNNGGEREEKAIQREIDEIKNTKRSSVGAVATPRSIEVR